MGQFSLIYNMVMALGYCQNFVSAQYLGNKLIEFDQFAYALMLTRARLGLLHVNFHKFTTQLWHMVIFKVSFLLNILGTNRWNLTRFCICQGPGWPRNSGKSDFSLLGK